MLSPEDLIRAAAFEAMSPYCDAEEDDEWRDGAADQILDAVLTALADNGYVVEKAGLAHDAVAALLGDVDALNNVRDAMSGLGT